MAMLERHIGNNGYFPDGIHNVSDMDIISADTVFQKAMRNCIFELYPGQKTKRPNEISVDTLANRSYKKKTNVSIASEEDFINFEC
jgi:hypothetical protein